MNETVRPQATPLYIAAKDTLLKMINNDNFPDAVLPSEKILSEKLGISRTTIREALIALQREGVITKIHGSGNRIHRSTLKTRMRIDRFSDFISLIEDGGFKAEVVRSKPQWIDDPGAFGVETPDLLDGNGCRYLHLASTYTADGKKAILSRNFIKPSHSIISEEMPDNEFKADFAALLDYYAAEEVANTIISFKPRSADIPLSAELELSEGTPILQWQEISYSVNDRVICFGLTVFHPDLINLSLLRKWR